MIQAFRMLRLGWGCWNKTKGNVWSYYCPQPWILTADHFLTVWPCSSAQAVIMKYHRLGGLQNRGSFSHSSGTQKAKIKVSAGFVSCDVSLRGPQMAPSSLCPHVAFSCARTSLVSLPFLVSSHPMILFTPHYLSRCNHVGFQHVNLGQGSTQFRLWQ